MKKPLFKSKKSAEPIAPLFPMRINKFLAKNGYSTRRGADELIAKRWVTINGKVAVLGDKINEGDAVEVKHNKKADEYTYYAFYKPRGTSTEKAIASKEFGPVLALDSQSEGLVIVTNDRRLTDRLTNPAHTHEKEYVVRTIQPLRPNFKEKMEQGVQVGKELISYKVSVKSEKTFMLRINDGGSHIRQMCAELFAEIESLIRIRILNISLGQMKPSERREIKDEELAEFLKSLGL